jgi:type II secretory ATPase GspE/PulE/Tfp pilus assembly ATPase PilB-like protein
VDSLAPRRLPDLFVDRPVLVCGRHRVTDGALTLRVQAVAADGQRWEQEVAASVAPAAMLHSMWGRARVRDLEDEYAAGQSRDSQALMAQIVAVSLESHVLSRFTAYVAVDKSDVVNPGGKPLEVVQPVELPRGWSTGGLLGTVACMASVAGAPPARFLSRMRETSNDTLCQLSLSDLYDAKTSRIRESELTAGGKPPRLSGARQALGLLLAEWQDGQPQALQRILDLILNTLIQSGSESLSAERFKYRVRVQFQSQGKVTDHILLPTECWDGFLDAVRQAAGITPSSAQAPQTGTIRFPVGQQEATFRVTITPSKRGEQVLIEVEASALPANPRKRTRFWA